MPYEITQLWSLTLAGAVVGSPTHVVGLGTERRRQGGLGAFAGRSQNEFSVSHNNTYFISALKTHCGRSAEFTNNQFAYKTI